MRTLYAVNAFFAGLIVLTGVALLFALGITGLIFIVGGGILAAIAGTLATPSRIGVALAVCADAAIGFMALKHLAAPSQGSQHAWLGALVAYAVPGCALVLVVAALLATAREWQSVRNAPWF